MSLPYRSRPTNAGTVAQHHDDPDTTTGTRPLPCEGMWIDGVPFPIPARQSARRPRYSMLKYGRWMDMDRRPSVVDYFSNYARDHDNSTTSTNSLDDQDVLNNDNNVSHALAPQPGTDTDLVTTAKPSTRQYLQVEHTAGGFIRLHLDGTTSGATLTRLLHPDHNIANPKYYELGDVSGNTAVTPAVGDMVVERTLVNLKFFVDAYQVMKLRKHTLIQEWKRRHPDDVDLVLRQPYEVAAGLNEKANKLADLDPSLRLKVRYVNLWDPVRQRAETGRLHRLTVMVVRGAPVEKHYSFGRDVAYRYLVTGEESRLEGHFDLVLPETEDVYRRLCAVVAGFTAEEWRGPDAEAGVAAAEEGEESWMDDEGDSDESG